MKTSRLVVKLLAVAACLLAFTAGADAIWRARMVIAANTPTAYCFTGPRAEAEVNCTENARVAYGRDGGAGLFVSASDGGVGAALTDQFLPFTFTAVTSNAANANAALHMGTSSCFSVRLASSDAGTCDVYGKTSP